MLQTANYSTESFGRNTDYSGQIFTNRADPETLPASPGALNSFTNLTTSNGVSRFGSIAIGLKTEYDADGHKHGCVYRFPIKDEAWEAVRQEADISGSFKALAQEAAKLIQQGYESVVVVTPVRDFHNVRTVANVSW